MEPALFYYNIRDKKIALRIVRVCAQEDNGILASEDISLPPSHIDMGLYGIVKGGVGEIFRLMNKKKVVFFSTFCCPPSPEEEVIVISQAPPGNIPPIPPISFSSSHLTSTGGRENVV